MQTATGEPPHPAPSTKASPPHPPCDLGRQGPGQRTSSFKVPPNTRKHTQPCSQSLPAGRRPLSARGPRAPGRGRSYRRLSPTPPSSARPGAASGARLPSCPGVSALRAPLGSDPPVPENYSSAELLYTARTTSLRLALLSGS